MKLYHFTTARHGLAAIRDKRLKVAEINKLNDPFEFLPIDLTDPTVRRAFTSWKNYELSKKYGLLCFSKHWKNPLMWGHYGENHRGLCLGFEVDNEIVSKVSYVGKRLKFSIQDIESKMNSNDAGFITTLVTHKYINWSYEREFRILISLTDNDPVDDLFYGEFSEKMHLSEVIIGSDSHVDEERITKAFGGNKIPQITRAMHSHDKFQVIKKLL